MVVNNPATIWLPIAGYEGIYEVSNDGQIRSLDRVTEPTKRRIKGRLLKPFSGQSGHLYVRLWKANVEVTRTVHTIVLETFTRYAKDSEECRHLNGDPTDNQVTNLCWGTRKENVHDAIRHGTLQNGNMRKQKCPKCNGEYEVKSNGRRFCRPCRNAHRRQKRASARAGALEISGPADK